MDRDLQTRGRRSDRQSPAAPIDKPQHGAHLAVSHCADGLVVGFVLGCDRGVDCEAFYGGQQGY